MKKEIINNYEKIIIEKPIIKYHNFIYDYNVIDDLKCKFCGKFLQIYKLKTTNEFFICYCKCKKRCGNKAYMQTVFGQTDDFINKWNSIISKRPKKTWEQRFIEKYGKRDGLKRYKHWKFTSSGTLEKFIYKYGDEEGRKRFDNFRRKCSPSVDAQIEKYGEEEGIRRNKAFREKMKKRSFFSLNYWLDLFKGDFELAKRAQNLVQIRDKKYFETKYGRIEGKKRYKKMLCLRKKQNTLLYQIEKYGDEEGKKRYKKMNELRSYKNKEEFLGHDRYIEINKSRAITLENMIKKYGEMEGIKRFSLWKQRLIKHLLSLSKGNEVVFQSKVSNNFFTELSKFIKNKKYIYTNKNEYWINDNNKIYFFDFFFLKTKKIIEFHGDFWHCNPKLYNYSYFHPKLKKTAQEIWNQQEIKNNIAKNMGFEVLEIWEYDITHNFDKFLKIAINFIGENVNE